MHHMFHHHGKFWKIQHIHSLGSKMLFTVKNVQTFSDLKDTLAKIAFALIIQEKEKFLAQP